MQRSNASRLSRLLALALGPALLSQAAAAQVVTYVIPLDPGQETPPLATGATGTATITLDTATGMVSVSGSYTGLSSVQTVAHIHGAAPAGTPAGVVFALTGTGGTSGTFSGAATLSAARMAEMLAGLHYVNIHSMMHAGGELRGQICDGGAVTTRNAGTNPASYAAVPPLFGGLWTATVDLTTTGHSFAALVAFDSPFTLTLGGGQTLLCLDLGGNGELFSGGGLGPMAGPSAGFSLTMPNDLSFCNLSFCSQAIHFGGVVPFALSNALDLTLGF